MCCLFYIREKSRLLNLGRSYCALIGVSGYSWFELLHQLAVEDMRSGGDIQGRFLKYTLISNFRSKIWKIYSWDICVILPKNNFIPCVVVLFCFSAFSHPCCNNKTHIFTYHKLNLFFALNFLSLILLSIKCLS